MGFYFTTSFSTFSNAFQRDRRCSGRKLRFCRFSLRRLNARTRRKRTRFYDVTQYYVLMLYVYNPVQKLFRNVKRHSWQLDTKRCDRYEHTFRLLMTMCHFQFTDTDGVKSKTTFHTVIVFKLNLKKTLSSKRLFKIFFHSNPTDVMCDQSITVLVSTQGIFYFWKAETRR